MHSDKELIDLCQKGDRKAQFRLYEKYSGQMYVVCLRYAKMQQEAEDILQESFIKVFKNIKNFRGDSKLPYWIKRIVVNTALNHLRNKLYLFPMVDVETLEDSDEQGFTLSEFGLEELLELLQELPTGSKVVFNLYAIEGYKHKEIAEMLGVSEGTSKSQYARAKMLLKEKLNELEKPNYERFIK